MGRAVGGGQVSDAIAQMACRLLRTKGLTRLGPDAHTWRLFTVDRASRHGEF